MQQSTVSAHHITNTETPIVYFCLHISTAYKRVNICWTDMFSISVLWRNGLYDAGKFKCVTFIIYFLVNFHVKCKLVSFKKFK